MPRIPDVAARPSQLGRRAMPYDVGGGEGLQSIGQATKEIGEISLQLFGQEMESRVSGELGRTVQELNSLQLEIEKEPDHNKRNALYAEKSQKIVKKARDGLYYPKYQGKFDERIGGTLEGGRLSVAQGVRKQQINSAIVNSRIFTAERVDSAKKSSDPDKRQNLLSEAYAEIDRMESGGLINPVTAYNEKLAIAEEIENHDRELKRFGLKTEAENATWGFDEPAYAKKLEDALRDETITGFQAARLMKAAKDNIAKGTKKTKLRARMDELVAGDQVDPERRSDMNALDGVYKLYSDFVFSMDDNGSEIPANLRAQLGDPRRVKFDTQFIERYGVLPNVVKSRMQAGLNAGRYSPERAVAAARHYAGLSKMYPRIVDDNFSNNLGLIAKGIATRSAGVDIKSSDEMKAAVSEVYEIIDMAPKETEFRDGLWKAAKDEKSSEFSSKSVAETFSDVAWYDWRFSEGEWQDVPGEMILDYQELTRQNFMLTKDWDVSLDRAREQIYNSWSMSIFAPPGQANLMLRSPEQSWGLSSEEAYGELRNDLARLPATLHDEQGNLVRFPGVLISEYSDPLISPGIGIDPTEDMRFFWEDSPESPEMETEGLRSISDFHLVKAPLESDLHPQHGKPQYYIYVDEAGGFLEDQNGIEILWSPDSAYVQKHAQLKSERDEEELMARAQRPLEMSILDSIDPTKPQWTNMPPPMQGR